MSLPSVPPTVLHPGATLCSAGSLGSWFPNVTVHTAALRLLAPRPRSASRFAWPFRLSRRQRGLPGSWATLVHVRRSQTPVEETAQDPGHDALCLGKLLSPSASFIASASTTCGFRGSMSPPMHSLSTLRSCPRGQTTQDSLPAGGPRPCRLGLAPTGHDERFQSLHVILLSQAFLAQERNRYAVGSGSGTTASQRAAFQ